MTTVFPGEGRNLRGYGDDVPEVSWPNGAAVAVSFVVNVEEGAERNLLDGDERNESVYEAREEVVGAVDPCMTSHYDYGPRAGYQRIRDALGRHGAPATFSTCGRAAERLSWLLRDAVMNGHEIGCHGWRWETHAGMPVDQEREIIARTHAAINEAAGVAPVGWHTRSASTENTRRLLIEHGGFLYDSDAYDDDMPYAVNLDGHRHMVLPYAFDTNDMRFQPGGGFIQGEDFTRYCLAAFDRLRREGKSAPRMLSIGLHLRIIGRPARIDALEQVVDTIASSGEAWIATRGQIARHWRQAIGLPEWQPASNGAG
ncbi:polysaccharide deacetylase family protein [Jiella marina]|uniref:polysaccharide deacetylase family protein n=1 Tax=Jiella sp. LLJ827 TaxID=2917712 RepID=UPI0021017EF1|nr:polysaccharide deacetylase family protein [Jiella sp. LLJ827]MCQ0986317.1 polysaccharide deacetylase family protein [Jiella sp. LLJ827]